MANHIMMAEISTILTLNAQGWSRRKIARELGLDRETVSRHLRPAANAAISTPGEVEGATSKPAISTAGKAGRKSACEPWQGWIEAELEKGLSAQRIYQDLVSEKGFTHSYQSVKRCVRRLSQAHPRRFERMECEPGEEAQVDFGRGAPIRTDDGHKRGTHVFRMVLSYSRKAYSEAVLHQTTESFIRCLENSFRYFGGVPRTLVIDNLRAAVTRVDWYEPDLNPKVEAFCRHYGTAILPTRPYTPRHKGKVERAVGYVKNNGLKGRVFDSLAEQNRHLLDWETKIADQRIHGTTRKQVGMLFEEHERAALQPLPSMLFPCYQEAPRSVHRDSFVEVQKSYYEVPEEYIGRQVWVRWDGQLVRVSNQRGEQIALHAQVDAGHFSRTEGSSRNYRVKRSQNYLLNEARLIGPRCGEWAQAMIAERGPLGIRALYGLLTLARTHSSTAMETACECAGSHGAYRLRDLRRIMQQPEKQESFKFMQEHPLIRGLSDYAALFESQPTTQEVAPV